ncbi:hypothetical protein K474DRAFT_1610051 [Panus rudis PR-1116 ss-1]|nr:hypothetical protein K474DRAFT_1610364 [Panus rudis PR-1116 ss-1]KAI0069702.1 hypothetical protein K474DRAFT_1610051 [Panus rudis PR-1116 ss-1]
MTVQGCRYQLCGIIYKAGFHFTSRCILQNGQIWFNDGMKQGRNSKLDGTITDLQPDELLKTRGGKACVALYCKLLD